MLSCKLDDMVLISILIFSIKQSPLNQSQCIALLCCNIFDPMIGAENIIKQVEGDTRVSNEEMALGLFRFFDKDGSGKLLLMLFMYYPPTIV